MNSTLIAHLAISEKDAARLMVTDSALGQLGVTDALRVIGYMKPKRIKSGVALIREGERVQNDFMMLILSGDVQVESAHSSMSSQMVMSVVGAGHLIGEMGLLNGAARSATCTAATELAVAVLSRTDLKTMMTSEPDLAARFLLALSSRMADRLRDTTTKLKRFMQLNSVLQAEVYQLMDAQDAKEKPKPLKRSEMPTEPMPLQSRSAHVGAAFSSSKRGTRR